jgi:ABC-type lipoprotein export system ATPase subunit
MPPVLQLTNVVKDYRALRPLRMADLAVDAGDRVAISGLDRDAAETFVNLVNGALVPDAGEVRVFGRSTAEITDGAEWLSSLDAFGIVTERAVLLEGSTLAQNLALPLSLEIDPMPADLRRQVEALAAEVDLPAERLDRPVGDAPAVVRLRAHFAKAVALGPQLVLFEHPTASLEVADARPFAETVRRVAETRRLTIVALTEDGVFADVVATRAYKLNGGTGALASTRGWRRFLP